MREYWLGRNTAVIASSIKILGTFSYTPMATQERYRCLPIRTEVKRCDVRDAVNTNTKPRTELLDPLRVILPALTLSYTPRSHSLLDTGRRLCSLSDLQKDTLWGGRPSNTPEMNSFKIKKRTSGAMSLELHSSMRLQYGSFEAYLQYSAAISITQTLKT